MISRKKECIEFLLEICKREKSILVLNCHGQSEKKAIMSANERERNVKRSQSVLICYQTQIKVIE